MRFLRGLLAVAFFMSAAPAFAQPASFTQPDATNPTGSKSVNVTPTTPFPVTCITGCSSGSSPSSIYSNNQTTTTSAAALPSQALVNGIVLKASVSNSGTVYVGPAGVTTATGWPLAAGEAISYAVQNLNDIYILGSDATQVLYFTGN